MRVAIVGASTETARIEGISAAGADPSLTAHTPSADQETLENRRPVLTPVVPVSPSGCPTPAVLTRAARELLGFEVLPIDAGLARPTGAPTVTVGEAEGRDIREACALPAAEDVFETARRLGYALSNDELLIGETIPGGTTTAMATLGALGERVTVSSSLPDNPLSLKRRVVEEALAASDLSPGTAAGNPTKALRRVGDPVLAAGAGLVRGATEGGTSVTLAGGAQLAAVGALARHAGVEGPLSLATTSFIAEDGSSDIDGMATDLGLDLTITDPGFDRRSHPATRAYVAGEAKEGVGMGGALALLERSDIPMEALRERVEHVSDRLVADERAVEP
jgi:uncharacterized protein (TIGR00303 family)